MSTVTPTQTPAPAAPTRSRRRFRPDRDVAEWKGAYVPYDLVKEFLVALVAVAVLTTGLALVFSSPDSPAVTLRSWSHADPVDFAQTAITELDGTSGTATYGPPYNTWQPGENQNIGPLALQRFFGVHQPVDSSHDFVVGPLQSLPSQPELQAALDQWHAATPAQQQKWTAAYEKAAANATFADGKLHVAAGDYGPVGTMIASLLSMARSGSLDADLISGHQLYGTDYTKPLLFIADGAYLENLATNQSLTGDQWGMMNEAGNFPGQAWLWLYTLWYQVPPMKTSSNGDLEVWLIMMVLTALLIFLPLIPGLRSIPRWIPVYRLVWRQHYAEQRSQASAGPGPGRSPPA